MKEETGSRRGHILARLSLYAAGRTPRKGPVGFPWSGDACYQFRCPVRIGDEYFDCAVWLESPLALGGIVTAPIEFVRPEVVRGRLKVGDVITLWERGDIGEAEVREVHWE